MTGGNHRTVRIWSVGDGKLLRTIWIPVGPEKVGYVYAVAISPDGSTIAAGGWTGAWSSGHTPIYLFDRESGRLIGRIGANLPDVPHFRKTSAGWPLPRRRPRRAAMASLSSTATKIGLNISATTNMATKPTVPPSRVMAALATTSYDGLISGL